MRKLLVTAAIACAVVGAVYDRGFLQAAGYARSQTALTVAAQVPDAKIHRAFVNKYCVGCHNSSNAQPASDPLNLEKASLDDVLTSAATWERPPTYLSPSRRSGIPVIVMNPVGGRAGGGAES